MLYKKVFRNKENMAVTVSVPKLRFILKHRCSIKIISAVLGTYLALCFLWQWRNRTEMKYVLYWSPKTECPFSYFGEGQETLIEYNCPVKNCFFTADRKYFAGELKKFDAIMFNGKERKEGWYENNLPKQRYPHQKYIYVNTESAHNHPVCTRIFDGFFNWTFTYRLDSDYPLKYLKISNMQGKVIGPNKNMHWIPNMQNVGNSFLEKMKTKKKAAAWLVSNCRTRSNRENFVKNLQKALDIFNLKIDIYGGCGNFSCHRYLETACDVMIGEKYFFYLAFENSFSEDYVTEKVLHALNFNMVPIVYGGANYSRFLPPGSYLDARSLSPEQLASTMQYLIENPEHYIQFFKWKSYYQYSKCEGYIDAICDTCQLMNDEALIGKYSSYGDFREWWYPDYKNIC